MVVMSTPTCPATPTVLIVEDTAVVSSFLEDLLTADGYEVRVATDSNAALAMLEEGTPDVILCDFEIPGGNAPTIYATVADRHPALRRRFLLMTGRVDEAVRGFLERTGVPWLAKPFAIDAALGALHELLGARPTPPGASGPADRAGRPRENGEPRALDVLTDALGELILEDELDDEDLREAAETLLPTLFDALRAAGYGGPGRPPA
jgi:CheY-like chemotaxis protein